MTYHELLFSLMAERDDAKTKTEKEYLRGYIDAICDHDGVDLKEVEASYQEAQAWAKESLSTSPPSWPNA